VLIDCLSYSKAQGWPIYYISWGLCLIGGNKLIMGLYGPCGWGYWLGCLPFITAVYRLSFYCAVGPTIPWRGDIVVVSCGK